MRLTCLLLSLAALAFLPGCDPVPTPEPTPAPTTDPDPVPDPEVLQSAITAPLEKARAVEDELMQAKDAQDAQIEEQGG